MAFATVESLSALISLSQMKSPEEPLSAPRGWMWQRRRGLANTQVAFPDGHNRVVAVEKAVRIRFIIAGNGPKKEDNRQVALCWIISRLTEKCGGKLHEIRVAKTLAHSNSEVARNAADLESYSLFQSKNKPGHWI
jgi:hypothetical protein